MLLKFTEHLSLLLIILLNFLKYLILEQYDQQKRKMLCKLQKHFVWLLYMGLTKQNASEVYRASFSFVDHIAQELDISKSDVLIVPDLYMGLLKHHFLKYLILEQYDQQKRKMLCKLQKLKFTEHLSLLLIILLKN
jgi:hypothetical protein